MSVPTDVDRATELLFRETTTIGLRFYPASRRTLPRETVTVETELGGVAVKKVTRPDGRVEHHPEFEAVKRLALESGQTPQRNIPHGGSGPLPS